MGAIDAERKSRYSDPGYIDFVLTKLGYDKPTRDKIANKLTITEDPSLNRMRKSGGYNSDTKNIRLDPTHYRQTAQPQATRAHEIQHGAFDLLGFPEQERYDPVTKQNISPKPSHVLQTGKGLFNPEYDLSPSQQKTNWDNLQDMYRGTLGENLQMQGVEMGATGIDKLHEKLREYSEDIKRRGLLEKQYKQVEGNLR